MPGIRLRTIWAGALTLSLGAPPLAATNYTISILNDNVSTNGDCSLREAIRAAVTDTVWDSCPAGSSGEDVITLPTGSLIFDGGVESVSGFSGPLVIQGPTHDRGDATVSCIFNDRFLFLIDAEVTLRDFSIQFCDSGASEGGAIRTVRSSLTLDNVYFALNEADLQGGAVFFDADGDAASQSLRIANCEFAGNNVDDASGSGTSAGGAVAAYLGANDNAVVRETVFQSNTLTSNTHTSGGGLYFEATGDAEIVLRDLEFSSNECDSTDNYDQGCGLAVFLLDSSRAEISGLDLEGNSASATDAYARVTGAYFRLFDEAELVASRLRLDANVNPANFLGQQIQLRVSAGTGTALVTDTLAVNGQTGLEVSAFGTAGGFVRIDHLTAADNDVGAALSTGSEASEVYLQNSILWGNTDADLAQAGNVTLSSNHVGGANPLFVNAATDNYRLTASSTDRDSGDRALTGVGFLDLDHAPRVVGSETDKGAYEYGGIFADDFESGDTSAW